VNVAERPISAAGGIEECASPLEFVPDNYFDRLDLSKVFGREAPVEVDAGCGDGAFLLERARRHPERNFLGIERLLGRVRKTLRRAERAGITNVRILRLETRYTVEWLLPPDSVRVMHVMFPDPWPKRRHHPRRLLKTDFLKALVPVLEPGGELRISTDHAEYYTFIRKAAAAVPQLKETEWKPGPDYPQTDFEKIFRKEGLPIYRIRYSKA
jgi:tRNA (guanine-N7-)-methyltransferase